MDKKHLSERDICTKYITPALEQAGWSHAQFREEVKLTDGRVMVRGNMAVRVKNPEAKGGPRRADYVLYIKPNLPIAVIEAKRNTFSVGQGMQQAVATATSPFELKQHRQHLEANFQHLFSHPEDVAELRGLIIDFAISGQMLDRKQTQHTCTGKEVLRAIEQARLSWAEVAIGQELKEAKIMIAKLRKQNVFKPEDSLPENWEWATLLESSKVIIDCDHKTPMYHPRGIHLVRTTDIRNGRMNLESTKKVDEEGFYSRSRRLTPVASDIFFTREAPMGEAAIVPQDEIVKVLDYFMGVCDSLESKLRKSNKLSENLTKATVTTLTGIQSQQEEAPLKTPQTELHASVKLGKNTPDKKANAPLAALVSRAKGEIQAKDLWQRFGGEIDTFYAQLKTEIAHGWLVEPKPATMVEHEPQQEAS